MSRILMDMRTVAADWMGNATSYTESDHTLSKPKDENGKPSSRGFYSRAAGPTATQVSYSFPMLLYFPKYRRLNPIYQCIDHT